MTEPPRESGPPSPAPARHGAAGYAVLAWLAANAVRFGWAAGTGFGAAAVPWWSTVATAAVSLLAAAALLPFLRFRRSGWEMAMWVLVTAVVMDVARIVVGTRYWIAAALAAGTSAFCLGYAWRAREAFADPDDWHEAAAEDDERHPRVPSASAADEAGPTPVEDALGAIHRRIVEAGSACAVPRDALLAEAARYGVRAEALRREGLSLYRTFFDHFRADGPLTVEEERELFCLEGALELDSIAVARLRAAAGTTERAPPAPAPAPEPAHFAEPTELAPAPAAADDARHPAAAAGEPAELASTAYTPGTAGPGASGLADYEEYELNALTGWAGIALPPGADPRASLETLRAFHRISTEEPRAIDPGHPLEAGEQAFDARAVELYRMSPGAAADPAPAAAPGLDPLVFVDGSLDRDCDLSRYQRAGACRFLVTDRRLLLVAPSGQQSPLPLDRIRSVHPHRNGLEVRPLRGSPVFLAFADGVANVAMRIARALRDRAAARQG